MNQTQAGVIGAVQELRDERDVLLDLLRQVIAAEVVTSPNGNHIAVISDRLMVEIHRRLN